MQKDGWQEFLKMCFNIKNVKELEELFDLFLTFEEKAALAARSLTIKALLEAKLTQREIAKNYKVSIAQITRGSNALKRIGPRLEKFLKNSLEE